MLDLTSRGRCFVIAEAGTAHADPGPDERFRKALSYVEAAKSAGADAVKFQMFAMPVREDMFCWIDGDEARLPRWVASQLPLAQWCQVKEFAEANGLVFLASAFQNETVKWLVDLKVEATKVASRAAKDFPYDEAPKPWLVSTGMGLPEGRAFWEPEAYLFQCEAKYPSTSEWLKGEAPIEFPGFSDHSGKPFLGIDAISRGCKLLEVHYRIEDVDAGPDLPACLTWDELKLVCEARDYHARRKAA